ncbi:MAG: hypothetical protein AAFY98_07485 [Verrucomicrobiota bacterium]
MSKASKLPLGLVDNTVEKQFVYRRRIDGEQFYQGFSYRRGKKREDVLKTAIRFANKKNKELGPVQRTPVGIMTRRNESGVVGVGLSRNVVSGNEYWSWVARWPGNQSGIRFSIKSSGGDNNAYLLACVAREFQTKDRKKIDSTLKRWRANGKAAKFLKIKGLKLV